ncbi:zinc metalloproteinase nas-14-like [Uloborus diversus]|uniref:zinc metalloproteinase nas-14-like n=1 Tax=Uloborus diversus TaxID=327109 RepID=UPI00240A5D6B|nr:zinc metalloproteinase nas-14-like [Uloborus diversus]
MRMFTEVINIAFVEILLFELAVLSCHGSTDSYDQEWFTSKADLRKTTKRISNFQNGFILGRNVITNIDGRWPDTTIPYVLDETYEEEDREAIRSAMDEFEKQTCISWVERSEEEAYVEIQNDMGCQSEIGYKGQVQTISLEAPLCMSKGRIMHELMHTLGFLHEHSRSDRDDYVYVVWDNVQEGYEADFQALPPDLIDDLDVEYDYKSVMHYTSRSYSRNPPNPTLLPTNADVNPNELGYGLKNGVLTDLDVEKINKFYECDS